MIAVNTTLEAAHELAAALKYRSKYARTQTMAGEYLAAAALLAAAQPLPEPAELEALRAELAKLRACGDSMHYLYNAQERRIAHLEALVHGMLNEGEGDI